MHALHKQQPFSNHNAAGAYTKKTKDDVLEESLLVIDRCIAHLAKASKRDSLNFSKGSSKGDS